LIVSGISLFELIGGDSPKYNRQIYCTANAKEQAKIVFNMVNQQVNKLMSKSKAIRKSMRKVHSEINNIQSYSVLQQLDKEKSKKLMSKSKAIRQSMRKVHSEINHIPSYSVLKPLSKDTSKLDGFNPTLGILDEYHQSKDDSMMEVLESGMIQQPNGLIAIIS